MNYLQLIYDLAEQKELTGHTRTAANYRSAARAFTRFLHTRDMNELHIERLTPVLAMQFENYLLHTQGVCRNTSSFYIRQLRAAYNTAVRDGCCTDLQPFRDVYKSVAATRKRAAEAEDLQRLFHLDLTDNPELMFSRDLFYFCFLGRGIPFIDLVKLQKRHIEGAHLIYQRSKTGQLVVVELAPAMKSIIERWHQATSRCLFPILPAGFTQRSYDSALRRYNRHLKHLSHLCGLECHLSSYIARHSWASEAYRLGVPIQTISTCMGHTTEETTHIYLRSLSTTHIDQSARTVLKVYG